jgi:hypothetical protein
VNVPYKRASAIIGKSFAICTTTFPTFLPEWRERSLQARLGYHRQVLRDLHHYFPDVPPRVEEFHGIRNRLQTDETRRIDRHLSRSETSSNQNQIKIKSLIILSSTKYSKQYFIQRFYKIK